MPRLLVVLLLLAGTLAAASLRLYLTDGSFHLVREYKVEGDRVRFYSLERSQWEEIPLALADLKRTEAEVKEREESVREETKVIAAEEKVEREQRAELARVPQNSGVYWIAGEEVRTLKQAEPKVVTNKSRSVLKVIVPMPVLAGKATVEIAGVASENLVAGNLPEFYFRLAAEERFGIVRLKKKKDSRVVENWSRHPVAKDIILEEHDEVEIFRRQLAEGLYKIWPAKPLEAGEYAVIEFTEGKGNVQVWDFTVPPAEVPRPKKP